MNDRLILCLGNDILSDDGLGFVVARHLNEHPRCVGIDIESTVLAGFALLDLFAGRREVLIIDATVTGSASPGTVFEFPADELSPTWNLAGSHQISLPTALEMGRLYGMPMPERIDIIAVEAADVQTLHEGLTPEVAAAVPKVVALAQCWMMRASHHQPVVSKFAAEARP